MSSGYIFAEVPGGLDLAGVSRDAIFAGNATYQRPGIHTERIGGVFLAGACDGSDHVVECRGSFYASLFDGSDIIGVSGVDNLAGVRDGAICAGMLAGASLSGVCGSSDMIGLRVGAFHTRLLSKHLFSWLLLGLANLLLCRGTQIVALSLVVVSTAWRFLVFESRAKLL